MTEHVLQGATRRRTSARKSLLLPLGLISSFGVSGCRHQTTVAYQPPPAPITRAPAYDASARKPPTPTAPAQPAIPGDIDDELATAPPGFFDDVAGHPVFTETGVASWYGPYHGRHAADGTAYDGMQMTAAHKTLPLGSTVRVTNLTTGQQILVRITDRGPFAPGRVIDLSISAAKAVGLYRVGIAKVQLEAYAHPNADPAGRWCVQTGAFKTEADAQDLKSALMQRYTGAKVAEFAGATGFWVRIDPAQRAKSQADEIADWIGQPDPQALPYVVRLD